jgi:chromosome segregation ATPase
MADTWLWGDNQDLAWGDGEMMLSSGEAPSAPVSQAPAALQSSGGYAARVRAKYEEIEAIERHIQAKEEAEREKVRKQEEAKRQLAELEEKKRQTKTIAERRRKLEARIAAYQSDIADLRTTILVLMDEIERARVETELQQTIADRRRRMLLMIAAAA